MFLQQFKIYDALANAGITPSKDGSHSRDELQSALSNAFGVSSYLLNYTNTLMMTCR